MASGRGDSSLTNLLHNSWQESLVGNAALLKSVSFKDSLESLGGPRVFVPLFALCETEDELALLFRLLGEVFQSDETSRAKFVSAPLPHPHCPHMAR